MQKRVNKFSDFLNEASLRGNLGIPGEEGSGRESWLDKIGRRSEASAREFAQMNLRDIQQFHGLITRSQQLQRGHEQDLSELTELVIREIFGTLIDDVELDLKISSREEVRGEMEKTPTESTEPSQLEELVDERIKNQIHKRKILRTIQQGKGLNVKAILNLSIFKEGLVEIMGREKAAEYLSTLNKISNVAQFFDWDIPEEMQKRMWQSRQGFSGSCEIEFPEAEEIDKVDAENVIDAMINGEDIVDNEAAADLLDGIRTVIKARGVDLSVLIHESIKGIYMLITQASLESLYGEDAETVIMNTDSLFDELQEIKFGRQMQEVLFKQVSEHPIVLEKINNMISQDYSDVEIAAFQEQLNFLFFGKIALMGQEDAREMLTLVNAILTESDEARELCDPIVRAVIRDLEQEAEYQRSKRGERPTEDYGDYEEEDDAPTWSFPSDANRDDMTQDEINDAIIDAYTRGDMKEVERLRTLLGESIRLPRLSLRALFEKL